ncbi:MAG: ABC transporter permease subunit [Spirochaetaceae bacterium]|jgi:osmoprotectant transport system permease protein|nr:ABC transporter permease subunit [Spirochaetaceae bacterium]
MAQNRAEILRFLIEHCRLTVLAVLLSTAIGVPLGIAVSYMKKLRPFILGLANIVQALPSLALLGFLIPFLGIGTRPAIFMAVVYSLLPIIKNTVTGLDSISQDIVEAATGIGMTSRQILLKVKLPLALPVIMAGVRISAVAAVGLVTIAAFIGAGGLGYLVYSGIRTVNTAQILSGAIPACLLSLGIDFLTARIEGFVSPIAFRKDIQSLDKMRIRKILMQRRIGLAAAGLCVAGFMAGMAVSKKPQAEKTLILGAKDYTEQNLMSELYGQLIEAKTDIQVVRLFDLGGTQIIFEALKKNEINMYVEYLGTAYSSILGQSAYLSKTEIYEFVKKEFAEKYGLQMFPALGFNNTYALAVRRDTAEKYQLASISDLAKVSSGLIMTPTMEFMNRFDGLPGLETRYNLRFKEVIGMDGVPRYTALINRQSDVIDAFSTDGLLAEFDLVILEDDLQHFPPYDAIPLVKPELLKTFPELPEIFELLAGQIDEKAMREMNYQVDVLKQKPETAAKAFLTSRGFL